MNLPNHFGNQDVKQVNKDLDLQKQIQEKKQRELLEKRKNVSHIVNEYVKDATIQEAFVFLDTLKYVVQQSSNQFVAKTLLKELKIDDDIKDESDKGKRYAEVVEKLNELTIGDVAGGIQMLTEELQNKVFSSTKKFDELSETKTA